MQVEAWAILVRVLKLIPGHPSVNSRLPAVQYAVAQGARVVAIGNLLLQLRIMHPCLCNALNTPRYWRGKEEACVQFGR